MVIIITFTTEPLPVILHRLLNCPCLLLFSLHSFDYPAKTGWPNLTFFLLSYMCWVAKYDATRGHVSDKARQELSCLTMTYANILGGFKSVIRLHTSLVLSGMVWPNVLRCARMFRTTRRAHEIRTYARLAVSPPQKEEIVPLLSRLQFSFVSPCSINHRTR